MPFVNSRQKWWFLVATMATLLTACGGAGHRVLEEVSEKVYTVEPDANISIHNQDGAILVYGSNDNELRVQLLKRAYSQERLNQIAIDVATRPGAVSITAKIPPQQKWFSDHSGTVDCTIVVPATASISALDLNAGEVLVDGVHGREMHARVSDGRIFVRNCFTNLDFTMNRGTLTLAYDWWEQEKFSARVKVGRGNTWVFLPSEAGFHLLAGTENGKISNDFGNVPLTTNSFGREMKIDQIINGGGSSTIQIRVEKGDIKIAEANP